MIDSGASGMGFVDPAFAQRCGAQLRPSSRRITLADGSEVRAAGEVTLTLLAGARPCHSKGDSAAGALHVDVHRHAAGAVRADPGHGLAGAAPCADRLPRAQHPAARGRRRQAALHPAAGALQRRRQPGSRGGAAAAQGHRAEARRQAPAARAGRAAVRGADPTGRERGRQQHRRQTQRRWAASTRASRRCWTSSSSSVFGEPKPGVPRKRGVEHAIQLHAGRGAAASATAAPPEREGRSGDEGVRRGGPAARASCSRRRRRTAAWR